MLLIASIFAVVERSDIFTTDSSLSIWLCFIDLILSYQKPIVYERGRIIRRTYTRLSNLNSNGYFLYCTGEVTAEIGQGVRIPCFLIFRRWFWRFSAYLKLDIQWSRYTWKHCHTRLLDMKTPFEFTAVQVERFNIRRVYHLKQVMGIEPTLSAWEAGVLPLNYTCIFSLVSIAHGAVDCKTFLSAAWRIFSEITDNPLWKK